ncbi:metallophosphoesterase [Aquibacillus albus]|uniref:MPP superfamily phosphohydrolase n=1 Tax=Aquibacillus albus TaxID=1168171 RepID=A0ABS2N5L8_9BACI|nr:putative MPP superfamily phosphohydrolase [Aquibacillus albus]
MFTLYLLFLSVPIYFLIKKANNNTKDIAINNIQISQNNASLQDPVLNILQLSDLHLENISITPEQLYNKLKDKDIDLIALTGDFLDRKRTIPKLIPYLEILNKLKAKHGIYAVLGNHDYVLRGENLQLLKETLQQYNCTVMQNENAIIDVHGRPVNIIGIDDFSTKRSDLQKSYKNINHGLNLVLTHDPNIVLDMKEFHFDYLLAGHFHGGQICYPKAYHLAKMGKLARMNITKGLHLQDGKPYYINEGLGQTGVNIRVGSRPEITLHQLTVTSEKEIALPAM